MMPRPTRRRIDHRPNYLFTLVAFFIIGCLTPWHLPYFGQAHARLDSLLGDGSRLTDVAAACLVFGCAVALIGAASGTPRFRPEADLRDCYAIQQWAIAPVAASAAVFDYGLIITREDWQVAILVTCLIIGLIWNARDFRIERGRLTDELHRRVAEVGSHGH